MSLVTARVDKILNFSYSHFMKNIRIGIISGIILGILDILMILPVDLSNKELVLIGAFSNRFIIGLFTPTVQLNLRYWQQGAIIGFVVSILPAVTNPAFSLMILATGTVGGIIVGAVTQKLSKKK